MKRAALIGALTATLVSIATPAAAVFPLDRGPYPPRPTPTPQPEPTKPHHSEGRWIGVCSGWRLGENLTPAIWNEDPARGELMVQRLLSCIFANFAPGQSVMAMMVVDRESSFYPFAFNASSGASGLMQHLASYWPGRVSAYLKRGWFGKGAWPPSPFDPRANLLVGAMMVAQSGWGAWGG